ncbi:MAG: bifunctional sugar-1-phosphate nucleotidylyltransferase/acetyltransferase [Promethearchaeota archaeon]|jgi:bifunctional UDP-N-acetylglucosamine pyrophosphorylase/glucosamine-1-phosphate N-acetyltransferase
MKAVILLAGEGKRLRPITSTRPKPMIPLNGKPLLEHTVIGLNKAGIDHFIFVVGYKESLIKNHFKAVSNKLNIKIEYVTQDRYLGTAHAVNFAKDFIEDESFLIIYGDIFVDPDAYDTILKSFNAEKYDGLITLYEVNNPQDYGVISLNSNGLVEKIVEKPPKELKMGNLINAGIYIFSKLIFKAIEKTGKSIRNEYEFTDSMEILINQLNGKILGITISNYFWNDIGLPWQLFEANHFLLNKISTQISGTVEKDAQTYGNVYIGKRTIVKSGCDIQGPCYIGEDCVIGPKAFIGPYSFVNNNCQIGRSEIKNSLVFSDSSIPDFNSILDSIICEGVRLGSGVKITNSRPSNEDVKMIINGKLIDSGRRKLGAILGPNSQIGINVSIMCGKKIGANSKIGEETLVNEDVPPNTHYFQTQNGELKKKPINL